MTITPPPRRLDRAVRAARARTAGLVGALLVAGRLTNPDRPFPIELCLLKSVTGVPCPTCGLTRSVCHALHGDLAASLSLHPAGILALAILAAWGLWALAEACSSKPLWTEGQRPLLCLSAGAAVLVSAVGWIARAAVR